MDPNVTLAELRELVEKLNLNNGLGDDDTFRMAELIEALDGWLTHGGFLPKDWTKNRKP